MATELNPTVQQQPIPQRADLFHFTRLLGDLLGQSTSIPTDVSHKRIAGSEVQGNSITFDALLPDELSTPAALVTQLTPRSLLERGPEMISVKTELLPEPDRKQSVELKRRISFSEPYYKASQPSAKRQKPIPSTEQTTIKKPTHRLALLARTTPPAPILHPMPTYKQLNTVLCVYCPPLKESIPLRLRSCMTMSSFFNSVLGAFEVQAEKVAALRIKFERVPGDPAEMATWLIKRDVPDSYDIFLDVINELSGWSGTTKCTIRVDIVFRV